MRRSASTRSWSSRRPRSSGKQGEEGTGRSGGAAAPRQGEGEAGGLRLRQHRDARRARRVGRRGAGHPDPGRLTRSHAMKFVVAVALRPRLRCRRRVGLRVGARLVPPRPLSARVRAHRPRAREELRPRPGSARGGRLRREPLRPERGVGRRRRRSDAAPPGDGQGDRASHRRRQLRRLRSPRPRDQRPLRLVVPRPPARPLRRHCDLALAAYHAGQGNVDRWRRDGGGIAFPETRAYVDEVERVRRVYATAYPDELPPIASRSSASTSSVRAAPPRRLHAGTRAR